MSKSPTLAWLKSLEALTRPKDGSPMTAEQTSVFATMLGDKVPAAAFNTDSLHEVARQFRYFPSYAELLDALLVWLDSRRPPAAPALPGPDGSPPLSPADQSWLDRYWRRKGEIECDGYRPQRGSVAADLACLASLVRKQSPLAWRRIAGDPGETVLSPEQRDAVIEHVRAKHGMPSAHPVADQQAQFAGNEWRAPDAGMSPAERAEWRKQRGLKTSEVGLSA